MSDALNNFTNGVKYLISTAIKEAPFDKTFNAKVTAVEDGKYTVVINGKEYTKTPALTDATVRVGDVVKVVFPQNNYVLRYIDNAGEGGTSIVGTVRYDTPQSLTEAQKAQARTNIGAGTGGGGGTSDHTQLTNRDAANQHPMSAITGLENEFAQISDAFSDVFEVLDDKLSDAPIDGKQYARKDGAWAVVESGSGSDEAYIVHIMLFNGEYRFEQGGSWGNIIDALYISDKVVVAEVWNGDGDEEQYVYSFGGYGIAPEHGRDLVFYRAEGNQTRYLYIHRDNSISAETVDLDTKFDKTGGQITGNVIASGAVGGSNLYADNGRGAVAIFSAEGTAEHTEAAVANEDGDLAPLLVADPSDDAHAATKYYVDRRVNEKLDKTGGVISGDLAVTGELSLGSTVAMEETNVSLVTFIGDNGEPVRIRNVDMPIADSDVATKKYVDEHSGGGGNNCEVKISYANNTYSADKTRDEIAEAISNGKFVYAVYDNIYYYYDAIDNYFATFKRTFVDVDEVQDITFDIYNDHVSREDITYDSVMNVEVEENDGEYTAYVGTETVSFADIEAAINNNRTVVITFNNTKYSLVGFGNDAAQFVYTHINTSMALIEEDVFVITPDGVFKSDTFGQYTKLSVFDALEERVSELEEHGGGTSDHTQLTNRDAANQHPMSAITGLENEFGMVRDTFEGVFNDLNNKLSDAPIDGKQYARKNGSWDEVVGNVQMVNGQTGVVVLNANNILSTKTPTILNFVIEGTFDEYNADLRKDGVVCTATEFKDAINSGHTVIVTVHDQSRKVFVDDSVKYTISANGKLALYFITEMGQTYSPELYVLRESANGYVDTLEEYDYRVASYQALYANANDLPYQPTMTVEQYLEALDEKLSDAPSDGKQYARKDGAWSEVQSGGADTVITGMYDTYDGNVTLNFPTGTTNYFDYINGLLQQNNDVRIEVDAGQGDWTAVFRHSKTSDDGQGRGYHVFQNCELMDDYSTNAGFLRIDETSVTYVQDDRGGGGDNTFVVNGYYDGTELRNFDKTFNAIESAAFAKKIIELHMHTDEQVSYYTLPMVGNDGSGLITFAGYDAVDYDKDHNMVVVTVDVTNEWNIIHPDYLPLTGGTISGNLGIDGALKLNIEDEDYDVDIHFNRRLDENRGTILTPQGTVSGTNYKVVIENVGTPVNDNDATTKKYVDDLCAITWIIGTAIGGNILVTSTAYNDAYNAVIDNKMCFMKIVGIDNVSILRLKAWNDFNYHSAKTDSFLFVDAVDADTNYQLVLTATGVTQTNINLEHEDRKVSAWTETPNDVNYPTEKLVKDNLDALKAYIDDQFKPHTIWEVEDAEDGITYSSGKSRQLSGSAWKLTGLNLLDNEGQRYARLKFYFRGCVGTVQDQEGSGVVLEMSLDDRFRTPRSNLFCATSVGYAINDNGVKAGVVANINVDDGWNNAKCATTYTNFNTTGTTALERDYRLYRIEAYKN